MTSTRVLRSATSGAVSRPVALALLLLTPLAAIRPADTRADAAPTASRQAASTQAPSAPPAPPRSSAPAPAPQTPAPAGQAASAPAPAASTLPRVRLVATGGTISNRPGERLTAEELIQSVPQLTTYVRPEMEQFANVASGQITLAQWVGLAKRINALYQEQPDLAGIVVTSGTDTLEELAYFLHLTVRSDRPVVVVGAMRRPGVPGYEGQANLLSAFRVAGDPQSKGLGALVVLNDEILSAREATKTDAQRLGTFQTRGYGVLGVVDVDRVSYYRAPVKRHTAKSEFNVDALTDLPRVDVLWTYQGAPGDLVRAAADLGARGIVIATAAGGSSGTQSEGIRAAIEKGVVVVSTTRTGAGRIMNGRQRLERLKNPGAAPAAGQTAAGAASATGNGSATAQGTAANGAAAGTQTGTTATPGAQAAAAAENAWVFKQLAGEDLAPVKARILLMLALSKTSDLAEIQRMFLEY